MTEQLFRDDAYLRRCEARVLKAGPEGIELDATVFYPLGGGQPGDTGQIILLDGAGERGHGLDIVDTVHGDEGQILHVTEDDAPLPKRGAVVEAVLDWDRRYAHMRMHTCLHLLGAVLPYGVTGGNITATRSRLDFDMTDTVDKDATTRAVNELIEADRPVRSWWVDEAELDRRPELVRTLSVAPPRGAGPIRLLEIPGVDLQPCGGTHVHHTGEIGPVRVSKVEKKGRRNRRVHVVFDG